MGRIAKPDPRPSLALLYAAHFGHLGIVLPFLPLWIHSRGLDAAAIGVLLALGPLSKLMAPWTWGRLADRTGRRRGLLVAGMTTSAAAFAALAVPGGFTPMLLTMALYAFCFAPGIPFAEATALEQADSRGFAYGRVRLWGSVAFIGASAGYGSLKDALPVPAGFAIGAALLVVAALAAAALPPPGVVGLRGGPRGSREAPSLPRLPLVRLLGACALMQASHGPYYTFYSIRLESLGYGGTAVGTLWGLAVLCEVLILIRIDAILSRLGAGAVLRLSLLAAALRWIAIGTSESPLALALAQVLHALTYAAFHVAALREVYVRFGPSARATGQALYSGLTYGLGLFAGTLAAGFLADALGLGYVFVGSGGVALAGLLILGPTGRDSGPKPPSAS